VTRDESFRNRSSIGKVNIDHRLRDVCSDNGSCAGGKEAISKRQRFMSVFSRSSDRLAASAGVGCTASFLRQSASMSRLQIFGGGAGGGEGAGDGGGVSSNATGVRPPFSRRQIVLTSTDPIICEWLRQIRTSTVPLRRDWSVKQMFRDCGRHAPHSNYVLFFWRKCCRVASLSASSAIVFVSLSAEAVMTSPCSCVDACVKRQRVTSQVWGLSTRA
jgi:hypothetical protein